MSEKSYRLYPYRWVVLAVFMLINIAMQMLWITYAPITGIAAKFYGVTDLQIGFLSMTFMIAFIPLSLPVSWLIDTIGFRRTVSIGAIVMAICATGRGLAGANYTLVLLSTIGLAIAQPTMLNAWTKVPALWFGHEERATAVGMVTLSALVGTALGMVLTPMLVDSLRIPTIQLIYGAIAAGTALLFLIFAREKPATPPCEAGQDDRSLMLDGLKHALSIRNFWFYLIIMFIGLGIFNGVTTWVETIIRPRGFTATDAGILGALMLAGGVLGAVIIAPISDKLHKRQAFLLFGFAMAIPCVLGLAFAHHQFALFTFSFALGFFLVSVNPVGMQYASEITQPTPEGTSNGLVQLAGQLSVVFVYLMDALKTPDGSYTPALLFSVGLLILSLFFISKMKDPAPAVREEPGHQVI